MALRRDPLAQEAVASQARRSLPIATRVDNFLSRGFDLVAATIGLVLLSPAFLVAVVLVRLSSPGPVFFQQVRIGRLGKPFKILKFRTMRTDTERSGGQLTIGDDPRVTPIGKRLRKWKLDEIPQLINVIRGDMALVGPRPEVPRYVEMYDAEQRRVLSVRPGITDPASIAYRSESELLASQPDPERFYIEHIMPEKLALNLAYLDRRTVWTDIGIILKTILAVLNLDRTAASES